MRAGFSGCILVETKLQDLAKQQYGVGCLDVLIAYDADSVSMKTTDIRCSLDYGRAGPSG